MREHALGEHVIYVKFIWPYSVYSLGDSVQNIVDWSQKFSANVPLVIQHSYGHFTI